MKLSLNLSLFTVSILLASCASRRLPPTAPTPGELPGPRADGSVLLPNQWSLRPAGSQVVLGDFPVNVAVHPDSRFAAVLHSGYGQHEIIIVDVASQKIVQRVSVNEAFYGLEFSSDGTELFCSGAGDEVVRRFAFRDGCLSDPKEFRLRGAKERGIPAGLVLSRDAKQLFAANVLGQQISRLNLEPGEVATNIALTPPAEVAGENRAEDEALDAAPFPYACRLDEERKRLYASLWAQSEVAVVDLDSNRVVARWPTEEHPCEMALSRSGKLLYVANAARNSVTVFDTDKGVALETLTTSFRPGPLPGATPNSLALSPDERTLFIANADNNNVAVFDVSNPGQSRSLGFIPVGWYPTSVRVTPDGKRLLVANGKGIISRPNRLGPQPGTFQPASVVEYIGGLFRGTLEIINLPEGEKFTARLAAWTADAYRCSPLPEDLRATAKRAPDNPIPATAGAPGPIKYCIYVIKENRTYDQVLGDLREGNGDPSLCLFGERIAPNHHELARKFVLLDNFYVEGEVSADGHEWTMGAYATDFVEKMWPLNYGHNRQQKYPYPSEGELSIARPAGGYLWDRAREAGVSYRSYGEFVRNGRTAKDPATTRIGALQKNFDPWYRSFDLEYSDQKRADRFIAELRRFEAEGEMPRLQIVRLPNDHTQGTQPGKPTPASYVADNDLALGRVVEAVSRSKFWAQTAIFVVEDDAQNGPDHVDAHRTVALVVSPYTRRGAVDSTMYSTSSMLRTMELILGLKPMSQYDAVATPMFNSFQAKPDLRPWQALPNSVPLDALNSKSSWGANLSRKMNFTREDAADDLLLNEVIWRSVRGARSPMPAPVRAAFVFNRSKDDDD